MNDRIFADFSPVQYEGTRSTNPLAFRHYDAKRVVLGKTMEEHLRFAICYWHSFAWPGADIFGAGTFVRPWHAELPATPAMADLKHDNAFDFFERNHAP